MPIRLIDHIRTYFYENAKAYKSLYERKKNILISFFLYFFMLISLFFVVAALVNGDYSFLPVDGSFILFSLLLVYLLKTKNQLQLVTITFISLLCVIGTLFIQTGGLDDTGILTALLVPLPVIFLLGKNAGSWTLLGFSALNVSGFIIFSDQPWFPAYGSAWIERVSIIYIILSLMAFVNEYVFDLLYSRIETMTNSFRTSQERYKKLAINKEKILSLISNDLNSHLGNFSVTSNILHEQYDAMPEEERKKLIEQLAYISQQNYHLMRDLLRWSTAQSETIPFSPKPVKPETVFMEVIELFENAAEQKKLSLFLKVNSNGEVLADRNMLGSIVRNLLSNAIKFSHRNGEIRISTAEKDDLMVISITDNGTGMNPLELQQARAGISFSKEGTMKEPGTGIGLILAREFVQKNRGEFFIESREGVGSEISFTLPMA